MTCPVCGGKLHVVEVLTDYNNETYRIKRCVDCGKRVYSIEVPIVDTQQVRNTWKDIRRQKAIRLVLAREKKGE